MHGNVDVEILKALGLELDDLEVGVGLGRLDGVALEYEGTVLGGHNGRRKELNARIRPIVGDLETVRTTFLHPLLTRVSSLCAWDGGDASEGPCRHPRETVTASFAVRCCNRTLLERENRELGAGSRLCCQMLSQRQGVEELATWP